MEQMGAGAAIAVHDLRKVYGNKAAVDGLDLEVPRGCFFGFLGPNGAGKTTTIGCISSLLTPTAGHIRVMGHDVFATEWPRGEALEWCRRKLHSTTICRRAKT